VSSFSVDIFYKCFVSQYKSEYLFFKTLLCGLYHTHTWEKSHLKSQHLVEFLTALIIVNKQVFFMLYLHFNELHVITNVCVVAVAAFVVFLGLGVSFLNLWGSGIGRVAQQM